MYLIIKDLTPFVRDPIRTEDETIAELVGRFKTDNDIQTQYKKITQQIEQGQSPARVAARFVDKLIRR